MAVKYLHLDICASICIMSCCCYRSRSLPSAIINTLFSVIIARRLWFYIMQTASDKSVSWIGLTWLPNNSCLHTKQHWKLSWKSIRHADMLEQFPTRTYTHLDPSLHALYCAVCNISLHSVRPDIDGAAHKKQGREWVRERERNGLALFCADGCCVVRLEDSFRCMAADEKENANKTHGISLARLLYFAQREYMRRVGH